MIKIIKEEIEIDGLLVSRLMLYVIFVILYVS